MKRKLKEFLRNKGKRKNICISDLGVIMSYLNKDEEIIITVPNGRPLTSIYGRDSINDGRIYFRVSYGNVSIGTSNGEYEHSIMCYMDGRVNRNSISKAPLVVEGLTAIKNFTIMELFIHGKKLIEDENNANNNIKFEIKDNI